MEAAANPLGRAPPIAAERTGPVATSSAAKRPVSDLNDGEIREEKVYAAAPDKSVKENRAEEKAEYSWPAEPARELFLGR